VKNKLAVRRFVNEAALLEFQEHLEEGAAIGFIDLEGKS